MSEMVERVARALSIADGMHPEACSNDADETPTWTLYIDDAKAAIEAMREPTEAMWDAGSNIEDCEGNDIGLAAAKDAWLAMIDEALK